MRPSAVAGQADYRADIDGLRAMAVSSVLVFHAFPGIFPGGFVGVDVFFVISGYLISGILFSALDRGTFRITEFYARRIRRIFPALIVVLAATLLFGWLCLMPTEFRQLGKHVLAGAAFVANFVLLNESGYFDIDSARKPLRHLWSLAVEEQFYLIWPVLLIVFKKWKHSAALLLFLIGIGSFIANLYFVQTDRTTAYYLPLTRFWELMLGGGLAYFSRYAQPRSAAACSDGLFRGWKAEIVAAIGFSCVVLSIFVINKQKAFPGWWAMLVCGGTVSLIAAGPNSAISRKLLANPFAVWLGLISYPVYLWHWPLLSYGNFIVKHPSVGWRLLALLASIALGWATYKWLELPIRHGKLAIFSRRSTAFLAAGMAIFAVVGAVTASGFVPAVSSSDTKIQLIAEAADDWVPIEFKVFPGSVPDVALFFGDSHMKQYVPRIELASLRAKLKRTAEVRTMGGCIPIPGIERRGMQCAKFVGEGFARAEASDVKVVVLAAQWSGLERYGDYFAVGDRRERGLNIGAAENHWVFDRFAGELKRLRASGKNVVVILSSPRGDEFDPNTMLDRTSVIPRAKMMPPVERAHLESTFAIIDDKIRSAAQRAGAEVLDPMDWFCDQVTCPVQDSIGRPVSRDGSHIRSSVVRERATPLDQFIDLTPVDTGRH